MLSSTAVVTVVSGNSGNSGNRGNTVEMINHSTVHSVRLLLWSENITGISRGGGWREHSTLVITI